MIVIDVPPECMPPKLAIERLRARAAKNRPPRRPRCKGKVRRG